MEDSLTPKNGFIGCIEFIIDENTMIAVKSWCTTHRNERSEIYLPDLAQFIKKELKQNKPHHVVTKAFEEGILMRHPTKVGWAIVV